MAKDTPDVFELLNQIEQLKPKAIDELLAQRAAIDEKLALLGHFETKTAANPVKPKKTAPKADSATHSSKYNPEKKCPVCVTNGHDGRMHRGGQPKFNDDDLKARGIFPPKPESPA